MNTPIGPWRRRPSMAETETLVIPAPAGAQTVTAAPPDAFLVSLKKELRPKDQAAEARIVAAVDTLSRQALQSASLISADVVKTIQAIIGQLDRKLGEQIDQILHHPDLQALEGSWRGLQHLVTTTETDELLKIKVMHVTKGELAKSLERFEGTAWDQSPLFKKIYTSEYSTLG